MRTGQAGAEAKKDVSQRVFLLCSQTKAMDMDEGNGPECKRVCDCEHPSSGRDTPTLYRVLCLGWVVPNNGNCSARIGPKHHSTSMCENQCDSGWGGDCEFLAREERRTTDVPINTSLFGKETNFGRISCRCAHHTAQNWDSVTWTMFVARSSHVRLPHKGPDTMTSSNQRTGHATRAGPRACRHPFIDTSQACKNYDTTTMMEKPERIHPRKRIQPFWSKPPPPGDGGKPAIKISTEDCAPFHLELPRVGIGIICSVAVVPLSLRAKTGHSIVWVLVHLWKHTLLGR